MAKLNRAIPKRKRGRPATGGRGEGILVRLQPNRLTAIDAWIAEQSAPMTRPEGIRAILDTVLRIAAKDSGAKRVSKPARASRARELAAEAIDKISDPDASTEERDERRRRLTKGPPEFQELRVDRPKSKGK
jgi:hypothetical protein